MFEIALAAAVALTRWPALLYFVAAWTLATESLFLVAGAPVWEMVERGGSYAAPIALALVLAFQSRSVVAFAWQRQRKDGPTRTRV